jgi:diadenosine tetraphosphate (Ap4A) HIT family hydrolase
VAQPSLAIVGGRVEGVTAENDCAGCRDVIRAAEWAGGPLAEDQHVVAFHLGPNARFPRQYLGRILVLTKRHVEHLSDLTEAEAVSVALTARRIAQGLRAMESVERVHLALVGHQRHPHFHLHVFPRYDWMPGDADWNSLASRDDAPLGDESEIIEYTRTLRPLIPAEG